jgi:hypothetical protein
LIGFSLSISFMQMLAMSLQGSLGRRGILVHGPGSLDIW